MRPFRARQSQNSHSWRQQHRHIANSSMSAWVQSLAPRYLVKFVCLAPTPEVLLCAASASRTRDVPCATSNASGDGEADDADAREQLL